MNYENKDICSKCGGLCCKKYPGGYTPQDIGKTNDEICRGLVALMKENGCAVDYWEGYLEGCGHDTKFIRPQTKKAAGELIDPSWGGECINLLSNGCKLPLEKRPIQCRELEPRAGKDKEFPCVQHFGHKEACCMVWKKHQDIIEKAIDIVNKNPFVEKGEINE